MTHPLARLTLSALLLAAGLMAHAAAAERTASFDQDPGWDGRNNRSPAAEPRQIRQDFGFSRTAHSGGKAGEAGGRITAAAEPAYYAKKIPNRTFADPLTASGTLACEDGGFHALLGFFNAGTLNDWRTPSSLAIRLNGRGDHFFAYVEYATSKWRAGGDNPGGFSTITDAATGRKQLRGFKSGGVPHRWTLKYDPKGNSGTGSIAVTIDDETAICHLDPGHQADGATFNRFGLLNVMKSADDGTNVWLDDVTIQGETESFDRDPGWEGRGNRRTYMTRNIRPAFDFGYSRTRYAGGKSEGELGGLVFRGDCRYPDRMASYGDRVGPLTLAKPLRASGRICLRRGVSDSTSLLGFYHSADSMQRNDSQSNGLPANFLGVMIEGPSREGFLLRSAVRPGQGDSTFSSDVGGSHILPDGTAHSWSVEFIPATSSRGILKVTLDGKTQTTEFSISEARFDRFGIVTTWVDGNAQDIYFDDLTYTARQEG
jgi:hypothetical protein